MVGGGCGVHFPLCPKKSSLKGEIKMNAQVVRHNSCVVGMNGRKDQGFSTDDGV